jgi:hypothetical protein
MGQKEILGAIQPDTDCADLSGRRRVGRIVDIREQLDVLTVAGYRFLVAIFYQSITKVEILTLKLPIGGLNLGPRPDVNDALSAIEGH